MIKEEQRKLISDSGVTGGKPKAITKKIGQNDVSAYG